MKNYLEITTERTEELENTLIKLKYEKRNGSAGYNRDKITIIPEKKWYWFSNGMEGIKIKTL